MLLRIQRNILSSCILEQTGSQQPYAKFHVTCDPCADEEY